MNFQSSRILILGYGNLDRQDDGVAWHILSRLAGRLGLPFPKTSDEYEFLPGQPVDLWFSLQLYPEMAEVLCHYGRVCFIDAHTGAVPEDLHIETLAAIPQTSPFTHHLTPASLLNIASMLYQSQVEACLISVRGYEFGFSHLLSQSTDGLAEQAVDQIQIWLQNGDPED